MNTKINTILAPVDFTEHSMYTLEIATQIAKKNQARLVALHIPDPDSLKMLGLRNPLEVNPTLISMEDKCMDLLNSIKNTIKNKYQFCIDIMLKKGVIVSSIIKAEEEIKADMLIIGTHGTSDNSIFLGSHAYFIVARSNCPVIAIPKRSDRTPFTKLIFQGKLLASVQEEYSFIKNILQKTDIVLRLPGLIKDGVRININVINGKIHFLGVKLMGYDFKSPEKFESILNYVNTNLKYVKAELLSIADETNAGSEKNNLIPVFSLIH